MPDKQKSCVLCKRISLPGYLSIFGHHICPACEKRLVNIDCHDPEYDLMLQGLKRIFRGPACNRLLS